MKLSDADIRKAGGAVRKVKLPQPLAQQRLLPTTLIVSFTVDGRPVPWSVSRRGTKNPRLIAWQKLVARAAKKAYGRGEPYRYSVRIQMLFSLTTRSGKPPDDCNLRKGTEDALQADYGGVIVDDSQVVGCGTRRRLNQPSDYARVAIYASDD